MIARPPLAVPLAALVVFLLLLTVAVGGWGPLAGLDADISDAFREYGATRPDLLTVLRIVTDAAAVLPFAVFGAVVAVALGVRAERVAAVCCATVTVLVPSLWGLLHQFLHHPRPADGFVVVHSNGFPSGHSANAAAAGLLVVLLIWPRTGRRGRILAVTLAAVFAGLVGLTRVALLAHWPADVLGGWLLALVVVPLAVRAVTGWRPAPAGPVSPAD
ncbi:MAG TPA: phosphatase PAP2 family protein [Micromonospora sp.]